jgi:hypothetical protein
LFRMGRNLNSYFLIIIDMRNSFLRNNKKKLAVVAVGRSIGRCCYSHFCGTIFLRQMTVCQAIAKKRRSRLCCKTKKRRLIPLLPNGII